MFGAITRHQFFLILYNFKFILLCISVSEFACVVI